MRIISKKRLQDFWEMIPEARSVLEQWYKVIKGVHWVHFSELKGTFNHADTVTTEKGNTTVVFNVGGNKYRIIAAVHYDRKICYILRVFNTQTIRYKSLEK